eukprot:2461152-Amphidinium_carterae.1
MVTDTNSSIIILGKCVWSEGSSLLDTTILHGSTLIQQRMCFWVPSRQFEVQVQVAFAKHSDTPSRRQLAASVKFSPTERVTTACTVGAIGKSSIEYCYRRCWLGSCDSQLQTSNLVSVENLSHPESSCPPSNGTCPVYGSMGAGFTLTKSWQ